MPFRVIPDRGKVAQNGIESPSSERCNVLSDNESRSQYANGSTVIFPEARAMPRDASALSSIADVLAGESTGEYVDARNCSKIDCRNVVINRGVGPTLAQDRLSVFVALDKPDGVESRGSFEAEFDATDAAE
jgi:hypothetical protein